MNTLARTTFYIQMVLLAALATMLLVYRATTAPAPFKTKAPAAKSPALVGSWNIAWGVGRGTVVFRPDGGYECQWYGSQWTGAWSITNGFLTVQEGSGQAAPTLLWNVELDASGLAGTMNGGGRFALTGKDK